MSHAEGCSTGGQINNSDVSDDEIVAVAVSFDATALRLCRETVDDDRCFIKGLGESSDAGAIVEAVAGLADSLRMTTTAEGVETREQLDLVRKLGCTDVQGFFYSPPVPVHELTKILAAEEPRGSIVAA